jgi:hypothetical protein
VVADGDAAARLRWCTQRRAASGRWHRPG